MLELSTGEKFELRYSIKRVELIEESLKTSILAPFMGGVPTIKQLKIIIGYALKKEGADAYLLPTKGMECAAEYISEAGIIEAITQAEAAIERDCPFLLKGAD